ncbi:glycosyltransferase family 1 protein [Backusella circina FSU 941]|nr:glycosyltransferase family 1 protein [Backusella circina FSU 941]
MIKKLVFSLLSASLLSLSLLSTATAAEQATIFQTFREPKNIGFAGGMSGSSHYTWVLTIMDELAERGHKIIFFSKEDNLRLVKQYPKIEGVSIGEPYVFDKSAMLDDPELSKDMVKLLPFIIDVFSKYLKPDYLTMVDMIKIHNIDLILCDHFFDPCVFAAVKANIPFIVTSTADLTRDSSAPYINNDFASMKYPTTETQTVWDRFINKFYKPLEVFMLIKPQIMSMRAQKKALGIDISSDPTTAWRDAIKLTNNVFGLMAARPIGPLVEMVGPIIPKTYTILEGELKDFMDKHKRVAYIAFGHNATPSKQEILLILTSLMETIESGDLDGFIWATVNAGALFPSQVTTSSNVTYNVLDMFENKNPDARLVKWSPQTAILFHPSSVLFISHGGFNSWCESLYAGVPMAMVPFYGDQNGNAMLNEKAKVGGILDTSKTAGETTEFLKGILRDQDGEIQQGVKRFQSLAQIHSGHGILRGADVVEEVAFVNVNGKLPHRYPVSRDMNFFKAHNIDIYGLLVTIVLGSLATLYYTLKIGFNFFLRKSAKQKRD